MKRLEVKGPASSRGAVIAIACIAVLGLAAATPARAESLRCSGGSISEGASRMAVMQSCGQPTMQMDAGCVPSTQAMVVPQPVYPSARGYTHGQPYPSAPIYVAPVCQPSEDWLYDRGPGNLPATVRFVSGVVNSITYGRESR